MCVCVCVCMWTRVIWQPRGKGMTMDNPPEYRQAHRPSAAQHDPDRNPDPSPVRTVGQYPEPGLQLAMPPVESRTMDVRTSMHTYQCGPS